MHVCMCTRAVELDRERAGIRPLRAHSQRFRSCALISFSDIYAIDYLARMIFLQSDGRIIVEMMQS